MCFTDLLMGKGSENKLNNLSEFTTFVDTADIYSRMCVIDHHVMLYACTT